MLNIRHSTNLICQVEKAQSVWADRFDDDGESETMHGLVHVKLPSGNLMGEPATVVSGSTTDKATKKAKGKAKASSSGKSVNPVVYATTQKAKSTAAFVEAQRQLEKALAAGQQLLTVDGPKLLGDDFKNDSSLSLVRSRVQLVETALNSDPNIPEDMHGLERAAAGNRALFALCLQDPYVKDLRGTILANEDCCQTIPAVRYTRDVVLSLYLVCMFYQL